MTPGWCREIPIASLGGSSSPHSSSLLIPSLAATPLHTLTHLGGRLVRLELVDVQVLDEVCRQLRNDR